MKKNFKLIVFILIAITLIVFGIFLFNKSLNNYSQDKVSYEENSSVDYKVYLKDNSYFDTPYLDEDKVYITSLIDYLDINFSYDMKLDNKRSGKYSYYVKGIMSANVNNTDRDYWQKEYDLIKLKEGNYQDVDVINFSENLKVNYETYNDLLLKFKEDFKLSLDGVFKVVLYIVNYIDSADGGSLRKFSAVELKIPLTKSTIEVPIQVNEIKDNDILFGEKIYNDNNLDVVYKIFSISSFILGLCLLAFSVFKIVRGLEKISLYNKELRKILKTYDGIIVNVNKLPNYKDINIIYVNSFNELLDAHDEIRQPISYCENHKKAIFQLINGNVIWQYVLKDKNYEK